MADVPYPDLPHDAEEPDQDDTIAAMLHLPDNATPTDVVRAALEAGWYVPTTEGEAMMAVAALAGAEPAEQLRETLERCICGQCFDCPDGWHSDDDMPCSCTPDCAIEAGLYDEYGDEIDIADTQTGQGIT